MPWKVFKSGQKWCVHKLLADGGKGEQVACHATEAEAEAQMRALYASEAQAKALRFVEGSDAEIEGLLLPYGGPFNGQDLYGEHFSVRTDFCLDWFPGERPLLYNHGLDADASTTVVGRIKSVEVRSDGGWMQAQLDKASKYYQAIKDLIEKQALQLSSGAMAHLVRVQPRSGEILRWPLVEGSLTPTPANLFAVVDFATAATHYRAIGLDLDGRLEPGDGLEALRALSGSYEDLIDALNGLINPPDPFGERGHWAYVVATFSDHVIVRRHEDEGETTYWQVGYSQGSDGKPKLGEATQVEQTYVPVAEAKGVLGPETPLALHADYVATNAAALLERTKALLERRIKEGRVLSTSNRRRLQSCLEAMGGAMKELQGLLDSTDRPAKAATVRRREIDSLRLFAATLTS